MLGEEGIRQFDEMHGKSVMTAAGLVDREQLAREYPLTRGIDGELLRNSQN